MKRLKNEMKTLIKNHFNDDQIAEVERLLETNTDMHFINYSILAIALEDDLVNYNAKMIKSFYNVNDIDVLNETDMFIARIITTLTDKTGFDVKQEYEDSIVLDPRQPELLYLIAFLDEYYL